MTVVRSPLPFKTRSMVEVVRVLYQRRFEQNLSGSNTLACAWHLSKPYRMSVPGSSVLLLNSRRETCGGSLAGARLRHSHNCSQESNQDSLRRFDGPHNFLVQGPVSAETADLLRAGSPLQRGFAPRGARSAGSRCASAAAPRRQGCAQSFSLLIGFWQTVTASCFSDESLAVHSRVSGALLDMCCCEDGTGRMMAHTQRPTQPFTEVRTAYHECEERPCSHLTYWE